MLKGAVLRYLVSDALSLTGNSIAGVVLPLVLLARTGDALAAGSLPLICAIPQFICGILGGALLDRANRKVVCVASDLISAASVALLPIVDGIWGLSFGWFVALGLLGAVGDVPGMTARDALLPEVCEREGVDLQQLVGASQSLGSLVTIAGPALAALLIGIMPDVDALWVTATCSCAAAAASATLPRGVGAIKATSRRPEARATRTCHRRGDGVFGEDRRLHGPRQLAQTGQGLRAHARKHDHGALQRCSDRGIGRALFEAHPPTRKTHRRVSGPAPLARAESHAASLGRV